MKLLRPTNPIGGLIGGDRADPITPYTPCQRLPSPLSLCRILGARSGGIAVRRRVLAGDMDRRLLISPVFVHQAEAGRAGCPAADRIRGVLAALDERGGTVLRQALAQKLGESELRMPGLVAALRRILNVDGYPVLSVDDASGSVVLNRQLLEVQFELTQGEPTSWLAHSGAGKSLTHFAVGLCRSGAWTLSR